MAANYWALDELVGIAMEWRAVLRHLNRAWYFVSEDGRLLSGKPRHGPAAKEIGRNKANGSPYKFVTLWTPHLGTFKKYYIHELVCEAFHGQRPSPRHEVRHIDGDHLNNHKDNLAWGTRTDNVADAMKHGVIPKGEKHHAHKLNTKDVVAIKQIVHSKQMTYVDIGKRYGISEATVRGIKQGRAWKHVTARPDA